MDNKHIVGIFTTEAEAIRAIDRLKISGYRPDEISVMAKDNGRMERVTSITNTNVDNPDTADGAVGGAVAGGIIGGVGAILAEIGLLAIPGIGPFLAAGPIVAALTGAIAGGAVGGLVGALIDLGRNEDDAKMDEEHLERGDILVLVDTDDDRSRGTYENFYENNSVLRDRYPRYDETGRRIDNNMF